MVGGDVVQVGAARGASKNTGEDATGGAAGDVALLHADTGVDSTSGVEGPVDNSEISRGGERAWLETLSSGAECGAAWHPAGCSGTHGVCARCMDIVLGARTGPMSGLPCPAFPRHLAAFPPRPEPWCEGPVLGALPLDGCA
jgi:hypothetical protein